MATTLSASDVMHIAKLANIPISDDEASSLASAFIRTLAVVEKLSAIDVTSVPDMHFTGLENVFRQDEIDEKRMFTQQQALSNAKTYNGYFVVTQVIDQDS